LIAERKNTARKKMQKKTKGTLKMRMRLCSVCKKGCVGRLELGWRPF
jgi:hypothetical protein